MLMKHENLKTRTKDFALRIIKLVESLPKTRTSDVIGRQLLRSGTSVAANYRSSCRTRSNADFISKMGIVEEEADESLLWLELLVESGVVKEKSVELLMKEADELVAIIVSSIKTARKNK
jgi:four helix bundle protein